MAHLAVGFRWEPPRHLKREARGRALRLAHALTPFRKVSSGKYVAACIRCHQRADIASWPDPKVYGPAVTNPCPSPEAL